MTTTCPPPPAASALPALQAGDIQSARGQRLVRIYRAGGSDPGIWDGFRNYGPLASMRFDHQPGPQPAAHARRSVMYGALGHRTVPGDPLECAILERFQFTGVLDRYGGDPWMALWAPVRPLRLLDLANSRWIPRAGANGALMSGPRAVCRDWSRAIWNAYPDVDGLLWSSSVAPASRSVVLYERARSKVPASPAFHMPLSYGPLRPALARIATEFGLTLI